MNIVTGIGVLPDIYIVNKVGNVGTFQQKIQKLIDTENVSVHSSYKPDKNTLFRF